MNPEQTILIGFSLGAHVVGFAGRTVGKAKIKRIIGLDPAGPGFAQFSYPYKLNHDDAQFVVTLNANGYKTVPIVGGQSLRIIIFELS